MKKHIFILLSAAIILFFGGCNDPVFYTISQEQKILKPIIGGSPTNFAQDLTGKKLFVATGPRLYVYDDSIWGGPITSPYGNIFQIAIAYSKVYALCKDSTGKTRLAYYDFNTPGGGWGLDDDHGYIIDSVYSAGSGLFVGARKDDKNHILYWPSAGTPVSLNSDNAANPGRTLNGAANNAANYFFSTMDGIYHTDSYNAGPAAKVGTATGFYGIINIGSSIMAIARSGSLYLVTSSSLTIKTSLGGLSSGALAVYNNPVLAENDLLLAGILRGTRPSYNYGYMEIELNNTNSDIAANAVFKEPGTAPSTLYNYSSYSTSLRLRPVNYLIQAYDGTLFASTQDQGVWSYRDHNGDGEETWNAENRYNHKP